MAANSTAVANQALQLIGTRTNIASLTESSNEAQTMNLIYNDIQDWCLSMANWNFARNTVVLTLLKQLQTPVGTWTSSSPSPPWLYEFALPNDFIRARYLTNQAPNPKVVAYAGELQRCAFATDTVSATQQEVLLTNQNPAILIYTQRIATTTLWPAYFERFMVAALAWNASRQLSGDASIVAYLDELTTKTFMIAEQINREEGLIFEDTTPEWIRAIGIDYPNKRLDNRKQNQQVNPGQQGNGNQR